MAKTKEEEEDKKSDGLEIISIGSLYKGSWDKKYWSSSRGKDRYPYPVGYEARRACNGSTYKMEIQEGPKGPLFLITSADGHSCSGQTPDIAWDKFQKKSCLRMKIWHGKRFSCKIDGIEFFGFRNPLVQRLLRELVANVNVIAEQSLLSSSFCNGASVMDQNNQFQEASTSSDLLPFLGRPHVTGKRSQRHETINHKLSRIDGFKRQRAEDSTLSRHTHKQQSSFPASTFSSDEMHGSCTPLGAVPAGMQLNSATGKENTHFSAKDDLHLNSVNHSNKSQEKDVTAREESELANLENNEFTTVIINSCAEKKPLDRLQDAEVKESKFPASSEFNAVNEPCSEEFQRVDDADLCVPDTELEGVNFPPPLEFKAVDEPCPEESQSVHGIHLYAPYTLDFMQDNTANSASCSWDKITCGAKEELMAVDAGQLVNESHLEGEPGASDLNASSDKSDFDSVGQDIATSMMTVLLPQAVPLLKKTSKKKKKTIRALDNFSSASKSHEENKTDCCMKAQSPNVDYSVSRSSEHIKSLDLDKFNGDQSQEHVMNRLVLPSNNAEVDKLSFGKDSYCSNGGDQLIDVDAKKLDFHVETSGSKNVLCEHKVQLNARMLPQDGDLYLSESTLGIVSTSKKIPTKVNQNFCQNPDENSLGAEVNSEEKNLETVTKCNEEDNAYGLISCTIAARSAEALGSLSLLSSKDTLIKAPSPEISNISCSQIIKKVYTRKKVPSTEAIDGKDNPPLSKIEACIKLADGCFPHTTGTLIDSKPFYDKKEIFNADTNVGGKLHDLHPDRPAATSNPALESQATFKSITQTNICASEGQDTSNLVVQSMSHVEKPQVHLDKGLLGLKNTLDVNNLGSQEEGTGSCHTKRFSSNKGSSEIMRQMNLELNNELKGIVEFLGCYFHPMPVLSLMLSRKGNEIYICALCGLLEDKDRTLFLYKIVIEGPRIGCPCFVGHTSVTWPSSTDIFGKETPFERSGLQLTPDGQCLVLLGSTKAPCCREGRLDCLCSACTLDCFENGVKIVQVKSGYISVLVKLKTTDSLQCLLVCEPDHLVAAGENKRLHLWTMNSRWSSPEEEFTIYSNDCISPCIMELKRIPKCASLVIGHDGFGEFTLWDISKHVFVSKFSAPSNSVHQFCPISLFGWQEEVHGLNYSNVEAHINRLMDATKMWFSEGNVNRFLPSTEKEDIAIWSLVSTLPDSDALHDFRSSDCQITPVTGWRLALLVKNTMFLGGALDPRASVIGTSADHGIIGTHNGLVYMWDFLTGKKLGNLHKFKGGSVSCIATNDSGSGVLAVADDRGQLLVYLSSSSGLQNQ